MRRLVRIFTPLSYYFGWICISLIGLLIIEYAIPIEDQLVDLILAAVVVFASLFGAKIFTKVVKSRLKKQNNSV